jgi:NAD(P)-dependent dehydrogenase (short-subunit alcohol dehydrogenase family)
MKFLGPLALAALAILAANTALAETTAPTVLITGANRGIGLELARQYAARGWQVIATARKPAEATALAEIARAHANLSIETLDLADHAGIERLGERLAGRPIDLLIHNAGISGGVPAQMLGRMDYDVFRQVLEVNTIGRCISARNSCLTYAPAPRRRSCCSAPAKRRSAASMPAASIGTGPARPPRTC